MAKESSKILDEFKQIIRDVGIEVTRSAVMPALDEQINKWRADVLPAASALKTSSETVSYEACEFLESIEAYRQKFHVDATKLVEMAESVIDVSDIEARMALVTAYGRQLADTATGLNDGAQKLLDVCDNLAKKVDESTRITLKVSAAYRDIIVKLDDLQNRVDKVQAAVDDTKSDISKEFEYSKSHLNEVARELGSYLEKQASATREYRDATYKELEEIKASANKAEQESVRKHKIVLSFLVLSLAANFAIIGLMWLGQ